MLSRLRARLSKPVDEKQEELAQITRLARRRAIIAAVQRFLPLIRALLLFIGYGWMVLMPSQRLGRGTYIDENALQPGQVTTHWDWSDVHRADRYLDQIERLRDRNATSEEKAQFIQYEFEKLGLAASRQSYAFTSANGVVEGVNAYGAFSAPRTSGTEAMVISASWVSRTGEGNGTPNLRGVATVLALAAFLRRYSLWAKDLVFVVSDGYLDGMHAWLSSYHGFTQHNLRAEPLDLSSGVIWTALCIDYPGHSYSHLGLFFEGINGRLPNQDLLNSAHHIARYTGGSPVVLYDHIDSVHRGNYALTWMPQFTRNWLNSLDFKVFQNRAENVLRHVGYQAQGKASGIHGLFHQFRIDAITLFAVPASGPHGFHTIGKTVESTLRTMNNLLERLHASLFFYVFTSPTTFLKIGHYLPSAVIVSISMTFGGLAGWVATGWEQTKVASEKGPSQTQWLRRDRPVLKTLGVMIASHTVGLATFCLVQSPWFLTDVKARYTFAAIPLALPLVFLFPPFSSKVASPVSTAPLSRLLKSFNLCLAGMVIAITSVLNFSLAASLGVILGIPLSVATPSRHFVFKLVGFASLALITPQGLATLAGIWIGEDNVVKWLSRTMWEWEILGIWFVPFVCMVYFPLVLQSMVVSLLPP